VVLWYHVWPEKNNKRQKIGIMRIRVAATCAWHIGGGCGKGNLGGNTRHLKLGRIVIEGVKGKRAAIG